MNPLEYREFLKNSHVHLAIPILRCQEALEIQIERIMTETNPYLKTFYTARAQRLVQSMVVALPQIKDYFREQQNPFILALLDEPLEPYQVTTNEQ